MTALRGRTRPYGGRSLRVALAWFFFEQTRLRHCFHWWAREGSNLQPDGYEPSGRTSSLVLLLVTQIDIQALPDGARARANTLIGLVAEERIRRNHPFLKIEV